MRSSSSIPARKTVLSRLRNNGNSADLWAADINVCGTTRPFPDSDWSSYYGDGAAEAYWPSINSEADRIDDPLIDVTAPVLGTPVLTKTIDDNFVVKAYADGDARASLVEGVYRYEISPGYYSGGINISQTQVVLEGGLGATGERSGIFAFGGAGLVLAGTSSVVEKYSPVNADGTAVTPRFDANRGVMIYVTGTGEVTMHGGAYLRISPRGDWLATRVVNGEMGVSIWQDRNDDKAATITGGVNYFVSGTVYMGYNAVKVTGNTNNLGTQLIVGALEIDGGLSLGVHYDGRNRFDSARAFLVN